MHFVILGTHSAEVCPTSNAKTKALLLEIAPQVSNLAEKHGVNIVAGPFANREHTLVVIAETDSAEALDSRLLNRELFGCLLVEDALENKQTLEIGTVDAISA